MERGEAVVAHGEVLLWGTPENPGEQRQELGLRSGPHANGGFLDPREAGGLWGHGVSSALTHTRLLGCSQSQTGPCVPTVPLHPLILGADLPGTAQPCCGVRGALGCCSPIQPPSKQPPVPGNASHWVIWTQADTWGPARKCLFFSGYHQLVPAQENKELADWGRDARFKSGRSGGAAQRASPLAAAEQGAPSTETRTFWQHFKCCVCLTLI